MIKIKELEVRRRKEKIRRFRRGVRKERKGNDRINEKVEGRKREGKKGR